MWKSNKEVGGKKKITDEVVWGKWGHGLLRVKVSILGEAMTPFPLMSFLYLHGTTIPHRDGFSTYALLPPFFFITFICIPINAFMSYLFLSLSPHQTTAHSVHSGAVWVLPTCVDPDCFLKAVCL